MDMLANVEIFKIIFKGKSFFNGATTQDLNDTSKLYKLVGRDSSVITHYALIIKKF